MIIGIGIDIVHVSRLRRWEQIPGLIERFFHEDEILSVKEKGSSYALSMAARFAAKEAFGKALGTGLEGLKLKDIQVVNNHNGKPEIILHGRALEAFNRLKGENVHISLTHERDNAVAVAIIEG